jgi:hypothetical protein
MEFISQDGGSRGTASISVPARGNGRYAMTDTSLTVGWVRVEPNPVVDLLATETIQLFTGATFVMEASVLPAQQDLTLRLPITQRDGFGTGMAVVNPNDSSAIVTANFIDPNGSSREQASFTLAARGQQAKFVHELFPSSQGIDGTLELTSASGIAALALRLHTSGIFSTLPVSTYGVETYFSPDAGTAGRIIQEIGRAQRTIDIAIYSFTRDDIYNALAAARARGIPIRILADSSQSNGNGSDVGRLQSGGFNIKVRNGSDGGIMHNKYAIFDGRLLVTGSYNWSANAEDDNDENAIFIRDAALISAFQANFNKLWLR